MTICISLLATECKSKIMSCLFAQMRVRSDQNPKLKQVYVQFVSSVAQLKFLPSKTLSFPWGGGMESSMSKVSKQM